MLIVLKVDVIVTICDYLDIWCLTIKHPWTEEKEAAAKKDELKKTS
jgi:ethanolaminephosphotransferase